MSTLAHRLVGEANEYKHVLSVVGMKEAMKNWLREHGSSEESVLSSSPRGKSGFQELVAFEVNLGCVFAKNRRFLSWTRAASRSMTIAFESLKSYYVED